MGIITTNVPLVPPEDNSEIREPEAWQFERPILAASIETGEILYRRMPNTKESKGVEPAAFKDLPKEERLKRVADLYNAEVPIKRMLEQFDISNQNLYDHINEAHNLGLIPELRSQARAKTAAPAKAVAKSVNLEGFLKELEALEDQINALQQQYVLKKQAAQIAQAVRELLGETGSTPVVAALLEQVEKAS